MTSKRPARDDGKTRFELRFDDELYRDLRETAKSLDVSVNRLMQGITRWALANANPNEEIVDEFPEGLAIERRPGCIWFGRDAHMEDVRVGPGPDDIAEEHVPPCHHFTLDFTERGIVREAARPPIQKEDGR